MTNQDKELWLAFHKAIHNPNATGVRMGEKFYPVETTRVGLRHILLGSDNFMEQNQNKQSDWADRARHGEQITWVIRNGSWGLIHNGKIITE